MKQTLLPFALAIMLSITISSAQEKRSPERIREQIRELRLKASELKSAGKLDEAGRVWQEAEALMKRLEGQQPGADKKPTAGGDDQKQWLAEREQKIQSLRSKGKTEEADRLARETKDMLHEKQSQKPSKTPSAGGKGDDARRKHLSEAIAHLRQAGMGELADKVQQQLTQQGKSEESRQKPTSDKMKVIKGQAPENAQKPVKNHGDLPPKSGANDDVRALRAELEELRKSVRELQQLNRDRAPRKEKE